MIELPPGWLTRYQQAEDKPAFLRAWAAALAGRAEWVDDDRDLDELADAIIATHHHAAELEDQQQGG